MYINSVISVQLTTKEKKKKDTTQLLLSSKSFIMCRDVEPQVVTLGTWRMIESIKYQFATTIYRKPGLKVKLYE